MNILSRTNLRKVTTLIFCAVFIFSYFAPIQNSYSSDCDDETRCGIGRIRSCSASGNPETLNFDPTMNGADIMFNLSNPVCQAIVTTSYAAVKLSILAMCKACGLNQYPNVTPSPVRDTVLIALGTAKAVSSNNPACESALVDAASSMGIVMAELGVVYGVAKGVFDNTTVCGSKWYAPNPSAYSISLANIKAERESWIKSNPTATLADQNYREWYYNGIEYEDNPSSGSYCEDPTGSNQKTNGHYPRQKYYLRGTQAGSYNCSQYDATLSGKNIPTDKQDAYKEAYECCLSRSRNYICLEYITSASTGPLSDNSGVFCKTGQNCTIKGITFSAAPLETGDDRLICAQTYSLCPYNFTVGKGGTKYCDYYKDGIKNSDGTYTYITPEDIKKATDATNPTNDCNTKSEIRNADCTYNAKAGQCKNYCQYLTHCTVVGTSTYQYSSNLGSPYFSSACYNFVGDSRNLTSYNSGVILGSQRHFSAPIAQCIKETLENVFYNRAGHSECSSNTEYPLADGTCSSGSYIQDGNFTYKKGNQVKDVSFFSGLQNSLQSTIKIVLTLAIMFFGLKLLVAHNMSELKKSDLVMFCIKIGLVMYFATGDAWQSFFFEGVYNASTVFSDMVFNIESSMSTLKQDGCQFDPTTLGTSNAYPSGKSYLSLWDTLDCKIARYLGFGPSASAANIALLIFAGIFTGPFGIYFVLGLMFFGFFFVAMTIRALHIFLSSAMAIILMVYISPIIIPMVLFGKTAGMFNKWLTNLISFCLQPMILFAYIAIFITVFDSTMIGSATFTGNAPNKSISCSSVCEDDSGNIVTGDTDCTQSGHAWVGGICKDSSGNAVYDNDPTCTGVGHYLDGATCQDANGNNVGGDPDCSLAGHTLVNPLNDSIACLIDVKSFGKVNFLESIGISLPNIVSLFTDHVKEKILTIIKAAFVMYVMCQFMDQIPEITSQLIGGTALPGGQSSAMGMLKSAAGMAEGIRERATRGSLKFAKDSYSTYKKSKNKVNEGSDSDDKSKSSGDQDSSPETASTGDNKEGGDSGSSSSEGGESGNSGD